MFDRIVFVIQRQNIIGFGQFTAPLVPISSRTPFFFDLRHVSFVTDNPSLLQQRLRIRLPPSEILEHIHRMTPAP
jgi:hypothetical protein